MIQPERPRLITQCVVPKALTEGFEAIHRSSTDRLMIRTQAKILNGAIGVPYLNVTRREPCSRSGKVLGGYSRTKWRAHTIPEPHGPRAALRLNGNHTSRHSGTLQSLLDQVFSVEEFFA